MDTLYVLVEGVVLDRSDAALEIARGLAGSARWFGVLRVLPRPLRDRAYDVVARRRHRWFPQGACAIPPPEVRRRFLFGGEAGA